MKLKYYLLLATVAYLCFLTATLPAKFVLNAATNPQINIKGISGTLWKGQANYANFENKIQLTHIRWNFILSRLLIGELSAAIQASFQQQNLHAKISITPTGTLIAHDVHAIISAEEFALLAKIPFAKLDGLITLDFDSINWKKAGVPIANGIINWENAKITIAETVKLGNITIKLKENKTHGMDAQISNQQGDLKINGLASIDDTAHYNLMLKMLPEKSASPNLVNSLAMFANRQNNGSYIMKSNGQLQLPGSI